MAGKRCWIHWLKLILLILGREALVTSKHFLCEETDRLKCSETDSLFKSWRFRRTCWEIFIFSFFFTNILLTCSSVIEWDSLTPLFSLSGTVTVTVSFAVCFGSLSCWKVHPRLVLIVLMDGNGFLLRISWYVAPFIFPWVIWIVPVPWGDTDPYCDASISELWRFRFQSHLTTLHSPSNVQTPNVV